MKGTGEQPQCPPNNSSSPASVASRSAQHITRVGMGLVRCLLSQWPSYRQLRAVGGCGRDRTWRPEGSRSSRVYIPANRWTGPRPGGRRHLVSQTYAHICISGPRKSLNPANSKEWGGCWSGPSGRSMLIPGFACPAPGNQSPVQLLQPQVPPACQPALLDLPGLPDDTPTE